MTTLNRIFPAVPSATEIILRTWLEDSDLTLFCGCWSQGGLMELVPRGSVQLTGSRYGEPFDGVRELRIAGSAHHVHLDLRRLTRAWYVVSPSVCYGFRPSFELRLAGEDCDPQTEFGLGVALANPYVGNALRTEPIRRYLRRAAAHRLEFPQAVSVVVDKAGSSPAASCDWAYIDSLLAEANYRFAAACT